MLALLRHLYPVFTLVFVALPGVASAAIWQDLSLPADTASRGAERAAVYYRALEADQAGLRQALAAAPLEGTASQGARLELPMPDGENQLFEVVLSPIMSPELAARNPDFETYSVTGVTNPAISGRLDMSPAGFHAMLTTPSGTVFIDPDGDGGYRSFYKQDYAAAFPDAASDNICHLDDLELPASDNAHSAHNHAQREVSTNSRRVYRLAMTTTGEYGAYFGSQAAATNHIITTINRVNQIFGRDLAVQLQLINVNVYLHAGTDPFNDPNDLLALLDKNQEVVDFAVGPGNYDIGHLFGLSGGGVAWLGSACTGRGASGYTGHPMPDIGDPFDIDFVAHELGHQLNAEHTFNGTTGSCGGGNRSSDTAVEPGSGTTIMAYAGICGGEDVQAFSDATFHATSIDQVSAFITSGNGSTCGTPITTSNGLPATINAGVDADIPARTPFVLTGSASADPNGDTLSYQWDEIDVGGLNGSTTSSTVGTDQGDNPLFRSFVPKSTSTRFFPRLSTLLAATTDIGETLPTTSRTLNFRMTVRDGNSGVGDDDVALTVDGTQGPFDIDGGTLNSNSVLTGGTLQTLIWNVSGTATDCPSVSISLLSFSADGSTYCDQNDDARLSLQSGIANSGTSANVPLPNVQIARSRVMLSCDNSVFFALSDQDLQVTAAANPIASNCKSTDGTPLEHGTLVTDPDLGDNDGGLFGSNGGGGALFLMPLLLALGGALRRLAYY